MTLWAVAGLFPINSVGWGFFAHRKINEMAIFGLPPEMTPFYKHYLSYLAEAAVNPDRRRYVSVIEATRHYIDLDHFPDTCQRQMPKYWSQAVAQFSLDTLQSRGVIPWHVYLVQNRLRQAFMDQDARTILRLSADLGHYVADAHVPLHTTANYNGQLTGQVGIHALWESRIPELFYSDYLLWTGSATYVPDVQEDIWQVVYASHAAVDSVLTLEKQLSQTFPKNKQYTVTARGGRMVSTYSRAYAAAYQRALNGMVARRLRASIRTVRNYWYTSWVEAGQPDLSPLIGQRHESKLPRADSVLRVRPHE